jgi:hypothetical protein
VLDPHGTVEDSIGARFLPVAATLALKWNFVHFYAQVDPRIKICLCSANASDQVAAHLVAVLQQLTLESVRKDRFGFELDLCPSVFWQTWNRRVQKVTQFFGPT